MKRALQQLLFRAGYWVEGARYTPRQFFDPSVRRKVELDDLICRLMFEKGEGLTFLQVGAYDGVSTDPLRKYTEKCGWKGIMVEPQPQAAKALRELYGEDESIRIVEAAIDEIKGVRTLYTVESSEVPVWAGGMASFDKQHVLKHKHLVPGLEDYIREVSVQCIPFEDVLLKLPGNELDLLQMDVEGADAYLLSLFPFDRWKPTLVHWESKNLDRRQQEVALDRVIQFGYQVCPSGEEDSLAILFDGLS